MTSPREVEIHKGILFESHRRKQSRGYEKGLIDPDIEGLGFVLGGGIRVFSRAPGRAPSGVVLVRGGPGTGKSALATQIAARVADTMDCDVLLACVELLPSEAMAQLRAFAWTDMQAGVIDMHSFEGGSREPYSPPWIAVSLLPMKLATGDHPLEPIGDALSKQLVRAQEKGIDARVVVIDSLIEGYGFGSQAPRSYVDELCKVFAELGIIGVLIEETRDTTPSPWCFAADTVLELGREQARTGGAELVRTLTVSKHRFGASHAGPHPIVIDSQGVHVFPHLRAYAELGFRIPLPEGPRPPFEWGPRSWKLPKLPELNGGATVVVFGERSATVARVANAVGVHPVPQDTGGTAEADLPFVPLTNDEQAVVHLELTHLPPAMADWGGVAVPFTTTTRAEEFLAHALRGTARRVAQAPLLRVLIGDLRSLDVCSDRDALRAAVLEYARIVRTAGALVILFETAPNTRVGDFHPRGAKRWSANGVLPPVVASAADVVFEVLGRTDGHSTHVDESVNCTVLGTPGFEPGTADNLPIPRSPSDPAPAS